jgi:hypothetical protein
MNLNSLRNNVAADGSIGSVDGADLGTPVSLVVAHPGHELLAFGWLAKAPARARVPRKPE